VKFTALCLLTSITLFAQQRFPLEEIRAEGVAIPAPILQALTGLKPGESVDEGSFRKAAEKLQQTGLFSEIDFHYTPGPKKTGYLLIFALKEQPERMFSIFDFPGKPEAQIWACIQQQYPWLKNPLPSAGTAQDFLSRAAERCTGIAPVVAKVESNMSTGRTQMVYQPRDLPHVTATPFVGPQRLTSKQVEEALALAAIDSEFTERRFMNLLEQNVRPYYDRFGMLNVKFLSISAAPAPNGVAVTTKLDEGLVYKLKEVAIDGDGLPDEVLHGQGKFRIGQAAEWLEILKSITELEKPLKNIGYIFPRSSTSRSLDDATAMLALRVTVNRGPLVTFNTLAIAGASKDLEPKLRGLWKLPAGAPMDMSAFDAYLQTIYRLPEMKGVKLSSGIRQLPGNKIDALVTIR
jgi:outer membrane protein assembly factor BamA